jgi:hypothetical protein
MSNPEHLRLFNLGVEVWNMWRTENPDIQPDLSESDLACTDFWGANLSGANLRRTNLQRCNLWGGDFERANLSGTNLAEADLMKSKLCAANLEGANLWEADLRDTNMQNAYMELSNLAGANLGGANLQDANLQLADLRQANLAFTKLAGSDLSQSKLGFTIFVYADLRTVKGLDKVYHYGSSSLDIDTLFRSHGEIPEVFLRGCGVSDQMIEYTKSLTNIPIQYYSCFISYSHKDEDFAKRLYADLQANNVRCWLASKDMKIGDKIRPTIDESIRIHDKLLLILSEHSVQSDWVEHEAEHALDLEKERKKGVLFPVRLDDAVMDSKTGWAANVRRQRHIGDFTKWKGHDEYKAAFERLLRDLKAGSA